MKEKIKKWLKPVLFTAGGAFPPRAYRFAASKNASMTIKFCSFDSGKCGGIAPLLK